jgi:hypothetical protein
MTSSWRQKGVFQLFTPSVIKCKQLSKRNRVEVCHSVYGYWDMSHQRFVICTIKASISLSLWNYHGEFVWDWGFQKTPFSLSLMLKILFGHEPTVVQNFKFLIRFEHAFSVLEYRNFGLFYMISYYYAGKFFCYQSILMMSVGKE